MMNSDTIKLVLMDSILQKLRRLPGAEETLEAMGFDSQDIIDLMFAVEERTNLRFDIQNIDFEQNMPWHRLTGAFG